MQMFDRVDYLESRMFILCRSLLVFVCFFTFFCESTSSECKQLSPCSCMFPNGEGYDLSVLGKLRPLNATDHNSTFYFHPCIDVPMSDSNSSECYKGNGVSLCAKRNNSIFSLGSAKETSIKAESDEVKTPLLILRHGGYTSNLVLICCDLCNMRFIVDSIDENQKEFRFLLISHSACKTTVRPKGLSVGSILLINFFIFTGVYFIGGAIVLKLIRGATGMEMIPNHTFWREIPSLVKEGIEFTFKCCSVRGYESI